MQGDTKLFEALLHLLRTEAYKVDLDHPRNSADAEKIDLLTFRDFCVQRTKTSDASEIADTICAALLGVESNEVSALFMLHYFKSGTGIDNLLSDQKNGGQYLRNRQGMIRWSSKSMYPVANESGNQTISKRLSEELGPKTVNLRTPVVSIDQSQKDKCVVTTNSGEAIYCRKVIVSIPTTLYHTITFRPSLPPEKFILSESAVMGYYSKAIFVFKEPWWRKFALSGILNADSGPIRFTRDTSIPADDQWSITCFIVGERGRAWSKLSKIARYGVAWDQFRHAFEKALAFQMGYKIPTPSKYLEMEWSKQAFFLGAPCPVMTPGTLVAFGESLAKPAENIHFVGTETATVWRGYMEGAVRSGQRGGAEVLKELKQTR